MGEIIVNDSGKYFVCLFLVSLFTYYFCFGKWSFGIRVSEIPLRFSGTQSPQWVNSKSGYPSRGVVEDICYRDFGDKLGDFTVPQGLNTPTASSPVLWYKLKDFLIEILLPGLGFPSLSFDSIFEFLRQKFKCTPSSGTLCPGSLSRVPE